MQISHVGYQTRGFDVANLYKLFSNLYEVNGGQKMSRFNSYTITRFDKYNEKSQRKIFVLCIFDFMKLQ